MVRNLWVTEHKLLQNFIFVEYWAGNYKSSKLLVSTLKTDFITELDDVSELLNCFSCEIRFTIFSFNEGSSVVL